MTEFILLIIAVMLARYLFDQLPAKHFVRILIVSSIWVWAGTMLLMIIFVWVHMLGPF